MIEYVHIVCLDAPSPANYGGAIDMHYKIKSLAASGLKIILHYFDYKENRGAEDLADCCEAIYSYKRQTGWKGLSFRKPYIIKSRINRQLIDRLNKDDHPIIFEGFHTTGIIPYLHAHHRKKIIRVHNDEAQYYYVLSRTEQNFFKRHFYKIEYKRLHRWQYELDKSLPLACLSTTDLEYLKKIYHFENASWIPCFLPWQTVNSQEGYGNYTLYHGNLSVPENEVVALWLILEIFVVLDYRQFIVAGKGMSERLKKVAATVKNVQLIENPTDEELDKLIENAHINVLPSYIETGVKLKILHALFNGRFCVTNTNGMKGTGLEDFILEANGDIETTGSISVYMKNEFTPEMVAQRQGLLEVYDNNKNALKLKKLLS